MLKRFQRCQTAVGRELSIIKRRAKSLAHSLKVCNGFCSMQISPRIESNSNGAIAPRADLWLAWHLHLAFSLTLAPCAG